MTKKQTAAQKEEAPQEYVVLVRIAYKAMIPNERRIIDPAPDPYAADAPRITLEHLSKADINRVIMRKCVAPVK